jgi:hypothetical protein
MTKVLIKEMNEVTYGKPYTVHPAADLFPLVEGQEFDRLVQSIREHGVQTPVMFGVDENRKPLLLDGRNRLRAVEHLKSEGIAVPVPALCFDYSLDGITPVEWIEAQNIDRRHLTDDARVMLAAQLHELIEAEAAKAKKDSQFSPDTARAAAAKRHNKTATADTASPQKRDRKKSEARTTAATVSAKAKTSKHKAKQAIQLAKATKAGVISPDVAKDVIAGKTKLKDAVPKKPAKAKAGAGPADDLRAAVFKRWGAMSVWDKHWARADMRDVRRLFIEVVREEQKQFDK